MYKKVLSALFLATSLILSPFAFADSDKCPDPMDKMISSLKLNDEQKAKVQPILAQLKSSIESSVTQIKDARTQLHQQIQAGTFDQSSMNNLVDQKVKAIGDIMKAKLSAKAQIYSVLNDDQKKNFLDMMKKKAEQNADKWKKCASHDDDDQD